ncbi:hypothetical protein NQ176_g1177 [Zarea fungicola]|uniref:Uncharacterized protein n=1 Tax=Zarea fungicola TaxID=93591 RepID=A0ACC1NUM0_9HYPO|nr:hypothetical protein NQ176_g1177 [Lecanicillium fungicola]
MVNPVGEDSWLAYLEEAARIAADLEQSVGVIELYKKALHEEPGSLRIWSAYCEYFWSLRENGSKSGWSNEEIAIGQELFSLESAFELWQQGYEAVKYRVGDSHLLWDRWIALAKEQLDTDKTPETIQSIANEYKNRLTTPHIKWEETSQAYSSFLSEYNEDAWESSMKQATSTAQETKAVIAARDPFETKLSHAARQGSPELQQQILLEYLDWETAQSWRDGDGAQQAAELCSALHDRALTGIFAFNEAVWFGYISFLSARPQIHSLEKRFDAVRRAVQHCPSSGRLWARYILCAEESKLSFEEIESIKEAAMADDQLCSNGMDDLITMYQSWCGHLKRTAMGADGDDAELADVAIKSCLEDIRATGKKLYGKEFKGDPKLRVERIYVQFLAEVKGAIPQARALWKKLSNVRLYADTSDFWIRYYTWEMSVFWSELQQNQAPGSIPSDRIPAIATEVLQKASLRHTIDWPEKIFEVYTQHCNDYESNETLQKALDSVYRAEKGVQKRRQREEQEQAAAYAAYYSSAAETQPVPADDQNPNKRKHGASAGEAEEGSTKRQRSKQDAADMDAVADAETPAQTGKRDRENSTILIFNLPPDTTQSKVRQYFKDYGHIKNFTAFVKEGDSITALVEFASASEAESALLRDQKYFGERQIQVGLGQDLTVYVANYPPAADEKYIRELFHDCGQLLSIRWPSLKVNAHRRFCYVSFRDQASAAKAVEKEGKLLEGKYKLLSKLSDPGHKKEREGAVAEGREVHVANLDSSVAEGDIKGIFSKYGKVMRVNIPRGISGKSRGFCFLDFETKEQAEKAVSELNNTKFRHQILQVSLSKVSKVKTTAKSTTVDADGDSTMGGGAEGITARTIAVLGLPDTVNDARVRKLVEPFGSVVRLVMQPMHGGAVIEFADAAGAGRAALELNSMGYDGYTLRTGSPEDLRRARAERGDGQSVPKPNDNPKVAAPASTSFMPAPSGIRRPTAPRSGPKRGLGFAPRKAVSANLDVKGPAGPQKSNADFKAMFLASGKGDADDNAKTDGEER